MDDDAPEERARVFDTIAPIILIFADEVGDEPFHAEELRQYVLERTTNIAPSSPDRILRMMRQMKILNYVVPSRSESLYQFVNGETEMDMPIKPSELVEEYIALRDTKKQKEAEFEAAIQENITNRMNEIEIALLDQLNALGIDSVSGKSGTAYKKISTSVTIADPREFRRHVIGTEQWDLANWSANKTLVNDMVERGEPIPPGVNRSAFYTIGIRRKT